MSKMFENAFDREKNGDKSNLEPSNPLKQGNSSGGGYAETSVKTEELTEKIPNKTPQVLSDEGTKNILSALDTPRQNRVVSDVEETLETDPLTDPLIDPELVEPHIIDDNDLDSGKTVISDVGISTFVNMGVEYLDIYMPKFLAWINEVEKSKEYKADPEHITEIKKYAVIVAHEYKHYLIELTPTQQLLIAIGAAYGPGLVSGAFKKSPLLFKFLAGGLKKTAEKPKQKTPSSDLDAFEPCLLGGCDEMIAEGEGYPKTSKEHPNLVEKFCSRSHQRTYYNDKGYTGTKSN